MKKTEIINCVNRMIHKTTFQLKKYSPEILVAVGVAGTVVSTVIACKATTKVSGILNETKNTVDSIHEVSENEEMTETYTEEDKKKDLVIVYAQTGVKLAKLYGPSLMVGAVSVSCILASTNLFRKRNAALAAAYTAVDTSFKKYRDRVVERFGKEVDHELRYNIKAKEIEETVTSEKGKVKTVKKNINVADPNTGNDYVKYFVQGNPYWETSSDYCEMFFKAQQNYANDRLVATGHLTLNEVYKMLGFEETKAGMVVGWIYDDKNPVGDNYVEFDIKEVCLPRENGDGYIHGYAIDFNVDGNIYNQMRD